MTPNDRIIRARIGAYSLHAQGKTNTGPARAAFEAKWLKEVDPDGVLPEPERLKRAAAARRAHFARLALKSAQTRRKGGAK